jgi:hypothetical protein
VQIKEEVLTVRGEINSNHNPAGTGTGSSGLAWTCNFLFSLDLSFETIFVSLLRKSLLKFLNKTSSNKIEEGKEIFHKFWIGWIDV